MSEEKFWVITGSAEHPVKHQRKGIVQPCHGKVAPLRRMRAGDGVLIYSPRTGYPQGEPPQAFAAIGRLRPGVPYLSDMGGGFTPYRRAVDWQACPPRAPIRPMLAALDLTRGQRSLGPSGLGVIVCRYGLTALSRADLSLIHRAMQPGFVAEGLLLQPLRPYQTWQDRTPFTKPPRPPILRA